MFNMFKRVKTIMSSELNAALDKAEDPVKMLEQFMRDMEADIRDAETAVAKQISNEKMLKKKWDDANAMVSKRQDQAMKALESDNDDLARRALQDKKDHEAKAETLKTSYERAKADADTLRAKLDEMKEEYRQMQLKKDSLKARAESAKTKTKINRAMSDIGGDDSKRGFERMEEKVLQYEAEAETSEDMRSKSRSLDDELDALDKNDGIDDELAELKKKMGKE
ncbi:PspA/IM30 family protein [Bacillus hwajinpoensis]|uniref:PspA/IM30 family protein n=1 Tax=Guptibacillus hwajinpoensis TaxID=208199 RepID=A0A845EW67_9BACL|nr:PspA/IM30 family protein [Pseudalkalibacillus hwajinpoensis]MYL62776.1 PspA/IM30 family protein [Pseudalkalibacillus hwajinpoensis]